MSSFKIFDVAGSGMSAQSVRLNTTASNLANADSVSGDPNQVYKAKHPLFEAIRASLGANAASSGVAVKGIVENQAAPTARYEPGNPLADAHGYVFAPNVNTVEEMVDMISASGSYQDNVEVMNTAQEMVVATLRLGPEAESIMSIAAIVNGTGAAGSASQGNGVKKKDQLGQAEFLELMIAQLKNQDPFTAMDPSQFLGQLAQFGTVSGISEMKEAFGTLSDAMRSSQVLDGATMVGREVLLPDRKSV